MKTFSVGYYLLGGGLGHTRSGHVGRGYVENIWWQNTTLGLPVVEQFEYGEAGERSPRSLVFLPAATCRRLTELFFYLETFLN